MDFTEKKIKNFGFYKNFNHKSNNQKSIKISFLVIGLRILSKKTALYLQKKKLEKSKNWHEQNVPGIHFHICI